MIDATVFLIARQRDYRFPNTQFMWESAFPDLWFYVFEEKRKGRYTARYCISVSTKPSIGNAKKPSP